MPDLPDLSALFHLPPEQALAYLKAKGYQVTWNWWEMQREAHARDFTVAKLARLDILADIRGAVLQALAEGQTERWFADTLEPLLRRKGWWGPQVDVGADGQAQLYPAGSFRRLQTIYRTNLQSAYMAGRQKQFDAERDQAPFVQYLSVLDSRTRPGHAALHGRVFRLDDPAWNVVAPPNGFNCRCRARNFSQAELDARELKVETQAEILTRDPPGKRPVDPRTGETPETWTQRGVRVPNKAGVGQPDVLWADVGWDYAPGRMLPPHQAPPQADELPPLAIGPTGTRPGPAPPPRVFPASRLLDPGASDQDYMTAFLSEFGATLEVPAVFEDVTGEPLLISSDLCLNRGTTARTGTPIYKVQKNGRERYLMMLAETLKNPQEIWERIEWQRERRKAVLRRRYLAWWTLEGQEAPGLAVFEWASQWWGGITLFQPGGPGIDLDQYLAEQRQGMLKWKEP
jgi:SPP1 gp7 family putative phage head morphogenesis protein